MVMPRCAPGVLLSVACRGRGACRAITFRDGEQACHDFARDFRYTADAELAPLFVGLPDDHCQCPHMGYVIKGRVKFAFADGSEELYEGGDAYYAPPGHLPTLYAGTEVVEFSPTAELQKTLEVVSRNMEAGGTG